MNFRFVLYQQGGYLIAGIGYELVASICTKGKRRCVTCLSTLSTFELSFSVSFYKKPSRSSSPPLLQS